MFFRADYHFHPNIRRHSALARRKIRSAYRRFHDCGISVVIVTEHVYKHPARAYAQMLKYKPAHFTIIPGMEYITKEGIDIIIFSRTESIYDFEELQPYKMTYEETVRFIQSQPPLYSFVTHPFAIGDCGLFDTKGPEFTKQMINTLGAVEARYLVFSEIRRMFDRPLLRTFFRSLLNRISQNEHLPDAYHPEKVAFYAAGSDAHFDFDIGPHAIVEQKNDDIFESIVTNATLRTGGERSVSLYQVFPLISVIVQESCIKYWYRYVKRSAPVQKKRPVLVIGRARASA